jgi:hypothetical protein
MATHLTLYSSKFSRPFFLFSLVIGCFFSCQKKESSQKVISKTSQPLDTLSDKNFYLSFEKTAPFTVSEETPHQKQINLLTKNIGNSYEAALKAQEYLAPIYSEQFYTKDSTLLLKLANGKELKLPFWDPVADEGYVFQYFFKEINYFVLLVQWSEGNCWMLVNKANGKRKYCYGFPYLSPDKSKIIAINQNLDAGYSFNGIEVFSVRKDSLALDFHKETTWGPEGIKWVNKDQFLLKQTVEAKVEPANSIPNYITQYKLVTIKSKQNQ